MERSSSCDASDLLSVGRLRRQASQISIFFTMYEVGQLKWLKHVIIEEEKLSKQLVGMCSVPHHLVSPCAVAHDWGGVLSMLIVELLNQDHDKVFEALSRAVASANEIGLQSAVAEQARQIVAFIKEKYVLFALTVVSATLGLTPTNYD